MALPRDAAYPHRNKGLADDFGAFSPIDIKDVSELSPKRQGEDFHENAAPAGPRNGDDFVSESASYTPSQIADLHSISKLFDAISLFDAATFSFFEAHGIVLQRIWEQDVCLGLAPVRFDDFNGFFELALGEQQAIVVIPACDDGYRDAVAFDPNNPNRFARLTGCAFALGEAQISNPATYAYGGHLQLWRSPLEWLAGECRGAVIIEEAPATVRARLMSVPRIACPDVDYALWLRNHFTDYPRRPKIMVPCAREAA